MSYEIYNLLKEGSLINTVTTISGVQLLDSTAIAALYDNDYTTPAYTLSGTPQSVRIKQEFGEPFDMGFIRYYTDETVDSRIAMSYTTVDGVTTTLSAFQESPGVYRADVDAAVNLFNLVHTVSGTLASAYQLELYGLRNETLGFGTPDIEIDYYHAEHSTAHTRSAAVNAIPLFNDSQYDEVAKVAIAPTLTPNDDYLFLSTSGNGPFYGINDYGFSQPGPNPISLHDDSMMRNVVDPQWVVRTPAQKHAFIPTEEGLSLELGYTYTFGGEATRETTGIYSRDAFTAQSFTAEIQIKFLDLQQGFDGAVRNFIFVLTNNFPIPDIGYFKSWLTDRRRGASVAGIRLDPTLSNQPNIDTMRHTLRWVDGSVTSNPDSYGGLGSASIDYRFAPDLFFIGADGEADELVGPTLAELQNIQFEGNSFGDFTDVGRWHTWKLVYDDKKRQISGYVDNIHLGDRIMKIEPFGEGCRLFVGQNGHGGIKMMLRNFKIFPNKVYRQYKVSSPKFGSVVSATIKNEEAYKVTDDSTSSRYVAPAPTPNTHIRIDFAESSDVVRYKIKQREPGASVSAYGFTYYPDVAVQAFVDFGGAYFEPHRFPLTSDFVDRSPTLSGAYPSVASGTNYIDFQFIEYERASQTKAALIIEEIEVYAEEYVDRDPPGTPDDRNIPWVEGRWNNLRQFGTSGGLAIKYRSDLTPAYYPYPEYFLQNVDYGVSSAVNGRQFGDPTNEYHHAGGLFSSPGTSDSGDYRQWESANQGDNHIFIWRYLPELSKIKAVYWESNTLNNAHVADKFKFQYLAENGDPNNESDWIDIPPVTIQHPYTGGSFSADTNYKNYKAYLIANNDGVYYTNYYLLPTYGTGFTIASQGSLVSYPKGLAVPVGYMGSDTAVNFNSDYPTWNGLRGYVEFDKAVSTRGLRMVIFKAIESGVSGPAGTLRTSFALERLDIFRLNGSGSYTSPVFDTGTPQNTERLSASIRNFPGTSSDVFYRSNENAPMYLYDDTYEIWSNMGSPGIIGIDFGEPDVSERVMERDGLLYFVRLSSMRAYDIVTDTWGPGIGYPASGSTPESTFDAPTDEAQSSVQPTALPAIPDDRVMNNVAMIGTRMFVASRTTGQVRTPRFMFYDFANPTEGWVMVKENRAPFSEYAFMVPDEARNRLYFFNEGGLISYFDLSTGNWVLEDLLMPTVGESRSGMGSVLFEDKVYIFGGIIGGPGEDGTTAAHLIDMKTMQSSTLASAPYRMSKVQAILVPEHRVIYVFPVGNGGANFQAIMKYSIDDDSWTTVESMMWFRDSVNLQNIAPSYLFYYDGYIYQNGRQEGMARAKVRRTPWVAGKFPDLRDPFWGGQLGTKFPWIKMDTLGEMMPQKRYMQFKVELYSDNLVNSPILEDLTVVTPHSIPIPASGTANVYLKVGVSPDSLFEAWYSADRAGLFTAAGGLLSDQLGDYSIFYTKSSTPNGWGLSTTVSGAWDPINDPSAAQMIAISAPWVIKNSPTSYDMWFVNDYNQTSIGTYGCNIHRAQSNDGISLYNDKRVIIEGVVSSAAKGVMYPCVIKLSPSSYRIWYAGIDASGVYRILSASSVNGDTWTGHAISLNVGRSVWDAAGAYRPCVLLEGSLYRMWYSGKDANSVHRVLYTESTDGNSWSDPRIAINVASEGDLDYMHAYNPFVLHDGFQYICYYIGHDGTNRSVVSATSPDGYTWFNFQLSVPPGGLIDYADGDGLVDFFVIINKDPVTPGELISGAKIKLYNEGAAL